MTLPTVRRLLRVVEQSDVSKGLQSGIAVLDRDVGVDAKLLDEYCFASPSVLTRDILTVVSSVRCADRMFPRAHSKGWSRHISVEVPVFERKLWASLPVTSALEDCLNYLTGDDWNFKFVSRKSKLAPSHAKHVVGLPTMDRVFLPYSDGLDSFAQLRLLQESEPDSDIVCVFTGGTPNAKSWKDFCRASSRRKVKAVRVPVMAVEPAHPEATFRSRSFVFYLVSAYGALLARSRRVVIPENGQGTFGGSLVPLGAEAKHRGCHPAFTHRLSKFLKNLTGDDIDFEHPGLFQTKGQVLKSLALVDPRADIWLSEHRSCSHDQRHSNRNGERVHCGVCGNCLLRRASLRFAGIVDVTPYKFVRLDVTSLEEALHASDETPRAMRAFKDLAGNSARTMERMAQLSNDDLLLWGEAATLARVQNRSVNELHASLTSMLKQHKHEWSQFLNECGDDSWLTQFARG